jgi:Uma2 family endonuclease
MRVIVRDRSPKGAIVATTAERRPKRMPAPHDRFVVNDDIRVPSRVTDLESFREWCRSDDYPKRGDVFWLNGTIWVGADLEQAYTHNLIKMAIGAVLTFLVKQLQSGHIFGDRMRLSNTAANLSCEPDLLYVSFDSLKTKRVQQVPSTTGGVIEFHGSPDMVLEVISASSEKKDEDLKDMYYAAGITEYWVVDARSQGVKFDIYRRGAAAFEVRPAEGKSVTSVVFGRSFQLARSTDPLGNPTFTLEVSQA